MKSKILDFIRELEFKLKHTHLLIGPRTVHIELTTKCNFSCIMCNRSIGKIYSLARSQNEDQINNDIVEIGGFITKKIFNKALKFTKHPSDVYICGYGEPLLHPDFIYFAQKIKSKNKFVHTITNGSLLNKKKCKELAEMDFDGICFSVDAFTQETYNKIRKYNIDIIFKNIKTLKKYKSILGANKNKPALGINFVAITLNIKELPDLIDYSYNELEICSMAINDLNTFNNPYLESLNLKNNIPLANKYLSYAEKKLISYKMDYSINLPFYKSSTNLSTKKDCKDFFNYTFITWDGKVISCCFEKFGIGDLNKKNFSEIWNGKIIKNLRKQYFIKGIKSICENCPRLI